MRECRARVLRPEDLQLEKRVTMRAPGPELERLVGIMARLRAEGGCPWDREQDLRSLRPYLIEEAYEVLDEMDRVSYGGPWQPLCEELGDLLFQIVFHAQLASEVEAFGMGDVARAIADKIESRHPHVFGEGAKLTGAEQVLDNWAELKAAEKKRKHGSEGSVLDGVPTGAPGLLRAERLTEKASRIGFDWPDLAGVRGKLDEELRELDEAIASGDREAKEHELGDVLFSLANLARFMGTPPEDALRQANARFTRRFHHIEAELRRQNIGFGKATLEQMEAAWQEAKVNEKLTPPPKLPQRTRLARLNFTTADSGELKSLGRFWEAVAAALGWDVALRGAAGLTLGIGGLEVRYGVRTPEAGGFGGEVQLEAFSPADVQRVASVVTEAGARQVSSTPTALVFTDPAGVRWRYSVAAEQQAGWRGEADLSV